MMSFCCTNIVYLLSKLLPNLTKQCVSFWTSKRSVEAQHSNIAISNVATNFRFPFANDIAYPWSVPHITIVSLCLQGGNGFFYIIYVVIFLYKTGLNQWDLKNHVL